MYALAGLGFGVYGCALYTVENVEVNVNQRCHQCGGELRDHFTVIFPDDLLRQFCDSDCLRTWFDLDWQQFLAQQHEEMRQLAREVNGELAG